MAATGVRNRADTTSSWTGSSQGDAPHRKDNLVKKREAKFVDA